jgi:hypothetical protein
MKSSVITSALLALAGSLCLQSQSPAVHATVPFDFTIGKATLPAGDYTIDKIHPSVLRIRNESDRHQNAMTIVNTTYRPAEKSGPGLLVFNKMGGTYILNQVWIPGNSTGSDVAAKSAEKELARRGATSETITLALR